MRTYTRKRPEYQLIEGVENLCRLCLEKPEEEVPIFTDTTDVCATLPMRIMICVGLEMVRENCLPNQICKECYKELERYYIFRKKCEVTYQKLKSHALAFKEKEFNKTASEQSKKEKLKNGIKTETEVEDRHLVLMFNGEDQLQVMNVVDLNGVLQVSDNENNQKSTDETETNLQKEPQEIEVQMQDISTTNPELSTVKIETDSTDMSTLLSAMLLELGILTQQDDNLIMNQDINTLELEGGDGSCITLELVEEDGDIVTEIPPTEGKIILADEEKRNIKPKFPYSSDKDGRGAKDPTCAVCARRFSSRSVLARHARVHSGERPHACRRCGRAFAQRAVLARHELVHAERRPWACALCPKSFTQRGALDAHARAHAPAHKRALALHRCARCPKLFLHASGLSRHMMVVHNGRIYECGGCGRQFRDKSALVRHVKSVGHDSSTGARDGISRAPGAPLERE